MILSVYHKYLQINAVQLSELLHYLKCCQIVLLNASYNTSKSKLITLIMPCSTTYNKYCTNSRFIGLPQDVDCAWGRWMMVLNPSSIFHLMELTFKVTLATSSAINFPWRQSSSNIFVTLLPKWSASLGAACAVVLTSDREGEPRPGCNSFRPLVPSSSTWRRRREKALHLLLTDTWWNPDSILLAIWVSLVSSKRPALRQSIEVSVRNDAVISNCELVRLTRRSNCCSTFLSCWPVCT